MRLHEEIKAVMANKGVTAYRVHKETGIDQAALSKFFSGERALVSETVYTLLDFLGYELTIKKKRKSKQG